MVMAIRFVAAGVTPSNLLAWPMGQASRLEGVTPAATNLIAITIKKKQLLEKA